MKEQPIERQVRYQVRPDPDWFQSWIDLPECPGGSLTSKPVKGTRRLVLFSHYRPG